MDAAPRELAWETFPHGSDVGVRGYGATEAEAFAHAAMALTCIITDPVLVRPATARRFLCAAPDHEVLLVDWLNALIAAMAADGLLFARFEVALAGDRLEGVAYGEPIDVGRHRPAVEIKGATFTELAVTRDADGRWRAQCVVDV